MFFGVLGGYLFLLNLQARLTEYSVPLEQHAGVLANVERPDHTLTTIALGEAEPGVYLERAGCR